MSMVAEDIATKVSTNEAQIFIENYYKALNGRRNNLASFYVKPSPSTPLPVDISLNGNLVPTPADLQTLFENQMPKALYEAQDYDCHVLNANYNIGTNDDELGPDSSGRKMSLLVVVSGYVKYGDLKDAEMRGFTENFVLVPNSEVGGKGREKSGKKWLIQSQNFRMIF